MNTNFYAIRPIVVCILPLSALFLANALFAQGCPGLGNLSINILPPPMPTIQAPIKICLGGSANLAVNEDFASYLWSNSATTKTIGISAPGNYGVTVTNSGGCTGTSAVQVQTNDSPSPAITGTPDTCLGQVLLNVGTGYASVLWSNDSTTNEIMVADSNTYRVTVTNSFGCTGTTTFTANILPQPQVGISGDTSLCNGTPITLVAILQDTATYLWSNGQSGAAILVNIGGTYSVTATKANGCVSIDSLAVSEVSFVQPSIAGPPVICDTISRMLSVADIYDLYTWSTGADTSEIVVTMPGTYSVTVTDANGCIGVSSHVLNGSVSPIPVIIAAPYACNGSLSLQVGAGYSGYNWSNNENNATITIDTSGVYAITVTNAQGCTGTSSLVASIPSLPSVTMSGLDSICQGSSATLSVPTGFAQYEWSNGANNTSISINTGGLYAVTVTDAFGCTAADTLSIESLQLPTPQISGLAQICTSGMATFTVIGGFVVYNWSTGANTSSIMVNTAGTYTVTVTSTNGCTATDTQTLSTSTNLQPQILESPYTCNSQIGLDAGTGFSIYQWSTGQTDQNIVVTNTGSYSVTVGDGNGCTGSSVTVVTIPPALTVDLTGPPFLCTGGTSNLSASPNFIQYLWSTGAVASNILASAGNTYTVTVTDNIGCTGTSSFLVQELPNPATSINLLPYACNGQLVLNGDGGFSLYTWTGPGGFMATGQQAIVVMNGNYSVVVTDTNGCTGVASIIANIPVQNAVMLNGPTNFCPGAMVSLNASAGFGTYLWNNGSTQQNITVSTAGIYTVTATDALGCSSTASSTSDLFQVPLPVIAGPTSVCAGDAATLNVDNTFSSILWSNGASSASISAVAPFSATVTVTDGNGCTGTASAAVGVFHPPSPVVSILPYECDHKLTLEASSGLTYIWEGPNGFTNNTSNPSVELSGTYFVTVTDINGCSGTASTQVAIPDAPNLIIAGTAAICLGQSSDLTASGGFVSYSWSNGQSGSGITVNLPNTYTVTATDVDGCTVSSSFDVEPAAPLSPLINGNTLICPGGSTVFQVAGNYASYAWSNGVTTAANTVAQMGTYSVTVTDAAGCTGNSSIQLDFAAAPAPTIVQQTYHCDHQLSLSAGNGFNFYLWSNGSNAQTLDVAQSGTYSVTVTNALGCTGTASVQAVIPPNPFAQIEGVQSLCDGNSALLTASGNALAYIWSNGVTGPTLNISQTGTYTVTATDAFGCTAVENHTLNPTLPIASTINRTTCQMGEAGTQIQTFTAANGCDSVLTIVTSFEPAKPGYALAMESQIEATIGQQIQINVGANFVIDSVSFQSPFSLSCSNCIDPTIIALVSGFIMVEAFDPEGCFAFGEIRINVDRAVKIYVPNVFYPGSDENSFFGVFSGPEIQAVQNFHVFDRWGNALFSREDMPTNTPGAGWDGSFRNQPMQPGVYVYYFEVLLADGSTLKYKGDVTIVK